MHSEFKYIVPCLDNMSKNFLAEKYGSKAAFTPKKEIKSVKWLKPFRTKATWLLSMLSSCCFLGIFKVILHEETLD
jgi:hypothetical protein